MLLKTRVRRLRLASREVRRDGRRLITLTAILLLASCAPVTATPTPSPAASPRETSAWTPSLAPTATDTPEPSATPSPTASPTVEPTAALPVLSLDPADPVVRAYPGPTHYEGDLLTLEITLGEHVEAGEGPVVLQIDARDPYEVTGDWIGNYLRVQFDTTGLSGRHTLFIKGERGSARVDESYRLELQPANSRPAQEENAGWATREIDCCVLHYITDTAAARDIDGIAETVQQAADQFDQYPTVDVTDTIDIFLIDRMWYNGAFGGAGELLAVYTDRYYGPSRGAEGLQVLVRHEMGHAVFPIFSYIEGLCVYLAGGHYKPEPIPQRAAAMLELGHYYPGGGPVPQHEIVYLHQAALINYLVETRGWERLRDFIETDSQFGTATPEQRDQIFEETLGISRDSFESDFVEWLRAQDPGQQVQDLELTIALQEVRREYQDEYAPEPQFLLGYSQDSFARPEYLLTNIREPRDPANVATELLIANAQQALTDGRYAATRALIEAIDAVVESGRLEHPLARDYGAIALALAEEGYEAVSLDLRGDEALVEATQSPPELETLSLRRIGGRWQLGDSLSGSRGEPGGETAGPTATPVALKPGPTPTRTPAPAPTELPADTLYFDDFSDPDSGWDQYSEMKLFYGYADDAYRVWLDVPGATYWFNAGESFDDAAVESRVTLLNGPKINRFGLMCRYDVAAGTMVQFLIDGRGRYGIAWHEPGPPVYLGAAGMQESPAVNPAGEPNLLRAVCDGSTLSFSVNGEELITTEDIMSSGSGDVGFVADLSGGKGLEVVYDYVLVTEP